MWDRTLLKSNAKVALKRFYWWAVLACLIVGFLTGELSGTSSAVGASSSSSETVMDGASLSPYLPSEETLSFLVMLWGVLLVAVVVGAVLGFVYLAFVSGPVEVGGKRFFMENRRFPSSLSTVFYGFSCGNYMNVVKTMFLRDLYITLWGLLFIIPGIIKSYEYYMVPYIMAENPTIPAKRALELSRQMTAGRKMDLFLFDFSFFGWYLLGGLLFGLGIIFVNPYVEASRMELYYWLRSDALYQGYSDSSELCDVYPQASM